MSAKKEKEEKKSRFYWITNQEECVVGMAWAKTNSGALLKFEIASGLSRDSYRAEEVYFSNNDCALAHSVR